MNLKTKVLVVRIIIVVLALIVIGFVIATFDNPDIKIKLLNSMDSTDFSSPFPTAFPTVKF